MSSEIFVYCNWTVSEYNGKLYTKGIHVKYLKEFLIRYNKVILISKRKTVDSLKNTDLEELPKGVELLGLMYFSSTITSLLSFPSFYRAVKYCKEFKGSRFFIRYPEPFAFLFPLLIKDKNSRFILHHMSNPIQAIKVKYPGLLGKVLSGIYFLPFKIANSIYQNDNRCSITCNGKQLAKANNLSSFMPIVNIESTYSSEEAHDISRLSQKVCKQGKQLIYLGYLRKAKCVDLLIEAFYEVVQEIEDIKLNIVGDGPELESLKNQAYDLGIRDKVIFHGNVSERKRIYTLISNSKCLILPSRTEGVPRVILEAMLCKTAVIASSVGEIPQMLDDGRGILLNSLSVQSIRCSILDLLDGKSVVQLKKAKEYAENYTIDRYFDKVYNVLETQG